MQYMSDMSIQVDSPVDASDEVGDAVTERILAAARQEFEQVGIQRSSMVNIAQRAGVSRTTFYRRFQGKTSLLQEVAGREITAILARIESDVAVAEDATDTIVRLAVTSLRELRQNALLNRLLTIEPEALYGYAARNGAAALVIARMFINQYLETLQARGLLGGADLAPVAEILVRVVLSQVFIPEGLLPFDDDGKVADFARQYLAPLVIAAADNTA